MFGDTHPDCQVAISFAQRTSEAATAALGSDIGEHPDAHPRRLQDAAYIGVATMVAEGRPGFTWSAPRLWSRFTTSVRRTLAESAGLSRAEFTEQATVAFAKVAEYQARGVVHFHAVVRLDGPDGKPPPPWLSEALLEQAIHTAAASTRVTTPASPAAPSRTLAWGEQIDIRPIGDTDDRDLSDAAVARYIAKYATKSTESAGIELRSLACRSCSGRGALSVADDDRICRDCLGTGRRHNASADLSGLSPHALALIDACWQLGGVAEFAELKLRRWAHMLGFRGHFATKSRT